jgi:hypothetical protein
MNILNKNNFIISKIIGSGGKQREGSLLIRKDRTVANDGRRLLEVINNRVPDSNHRDILISTSTSKEAMAMANKNDVSVTETHDNEVAFEAVDSESGIKKSMQLEPLFIPLKIEHYEGFESGEKADELRLYGPRWNERTCRIGRGVVLSRGYGKKHRLTGKISGFKKQHGSTFGSTYKAAILDCFNLKDKTLDVQIAVIGIEILKQAQGDKEEG